MKPVKRSWTTFLVVGALAALLVVLAMLQYRWQSQIAVGNAESMQKRLQDDANRFAADFDLEIQNAYFNFQIDPEDATRMDWSDLDRRFEYWHEKAKFPDLIKDLYYFDANGNAPPLLFTPAGRRFEPAEMSGEVTALKMRILADRGSDPVYSDIFTLVLPVRKAASGIDRFEIRRKSDGKLSPPPMPDAKGYLAIRLDPTVIKEQILPSLAAKHFEDSNFNLEVVDQDRDLIYQLKAPVDNADATTGLFDLSPNNVILFANKDVLPAANGTKSPKIVVGQRIESREFRQVEANRDVSGTVNIQLRSDGEPKTKVFATRMNSDEKPWTLLMQHRDGSIAAFVANTKLRNLGIGFGILALLAAAVGAILVSTQRARRYAQRQVDFVSSVSHEFRTPLAVIYSAGENLADGVAKNSLQISQYGELIKDEGKKLTSMVEQILTFAGANSGKRQYSFATTSINDVVEEALAECSLMIEKNGMALTKDIAEPLPNIDADRAALGQAVQNLIANAIKYRNGDRRLRLAVKNGGGDVLISVEDHGIGISKKDINKIFEPFFRAQEVVDAQIHGNGLGLSIVRQIATRHGGRVFVTSEPGVGSKFTISIPVFVRS